MLTAQKIKDMMEFGKIIIDPFDESKLNPNSYNITLDNKLLVYKGIPSNREEFLSSRKVLDMKAENPTEEIIIPESGLILEPGVLYLGSSVEYTETHRHIACIDGRSSIGRLGLNVHATAGFGGIGFCGKWTLEISCIQPIRIYPYIEIGQIYYFEPDGEIVKTYSGKYQNQDDVTASRMFKDIT